MKNKKKVIGIITGLLVVAIIITCILLIGGKGENENTEKGNDNQPTTKEEITISFNADGGQSVESIKIEKGTSTTLPTTEKEKYNFLGWTIDNELINDTYIFNEDTELKAKWEEIKEDAKTYTISFDSKGGSQVSKITLECDKTIPSLPTPSKDGYKFVSWADKNGKVIGVGALLSCENVTLYANWEKKEDTEAKKTYTCPSEYTLNGTKCTIAKEPTLVCPTGTKEDGDDCVKISDYNIGTRVCVQKTLESHDYNGEYYQPSNAAPATCLYAPMNSYSNQTACQNASYTWHNGTSKCYKLVIVGSPEYTTTCESGYKAYTSAELQSKFNSYNNGGCYRVYSKDKICDSDFILTNNKCVKTIYATVK